MTLTDNRLRNLLLAIAILHLSVLLVDAQYQYLLNPSSYSRVLDTYGDQYAVGSILQPQGGRVRRYDGHNEYYGQYNAYNNPSAYPPTPQFNTGQFGFFGRR